ncbi:MAG: SLBB domain-containing protein, partial [Armatimonadetes bacterium]|nr:SLBB domain-containing protein [Armatimonadota bacterium]
MSSKLTLLFVTLLVALCGSLFAEQTPLKPGDIVGIVVVGEADLSRTYTVLEDGAVMLPGEYGRVLVGGKTPAAAEEEVRTALRRYIKNPDVHLEPVKIKGTTIRIEGAVKSPGRVEIQGDVSARDVLAFAGGPVPTADLSSVTIARDGRIISVDLQKLKADTNPENNVMISDGDVITVPDKLIGNFTILGAVKAPGPYPLIRGMRILEAITLAGGELEASKVTTAKIVSSDQKSTQSVNLTDLKWKGAIGENKVIMPGDTIVVEADSGEPGSYFVSGAVNKPGQ